MLICREVVMKKQGFVPGILRGATKMLKMFRHRSVLFLGVFVLCCVVGCAAREGGSRKTVFRSPFSRRLVSPKLVEHAKLEVVWEKELPIGETESVERLFILGNRLYVLSSQNYITSLNRENGNFVFGRSLAPAGFVVLGLQLYENELVSIVGNRLVEIDPDSGTERSSKRLEFGITCPAVRNSSHFYLAGADRRLQVWRAEDKVKLFEVAAENDSIITSVVADDDSVVFATDAGDVISIVPDRRRRLWQFNAADGIVGPIVKDGESLFVASKDTYVYRLNVRTGPPPVWKFQTGAILDKAPLVTRRVVYQYVCDKGLTAIDRESGKFMWQVEKGVDLLAEARGKAYVIGEKGELVVMDNSKNKQLYSVNFADVSRYAANAVDSKIYVADEIGRVACLKPVE
jgi:outer membrane protein assembly factor BamB